MAKTKTMFLTSKEYLKKALSATAILSLMVSSLAFTPNEASAAPFTPNEASATATAAPNTVSTAQTTYTIVFTPVTALTDGQKFTITFPSEYTSSFASLVDADVSVSGTNISSTVETFDDTQNRITSTLTTTGSVSTPITITIGDTAGGLNDLTNPSVAGAYGIGIDTFDESDELIDQGIAYADIGGGVSVSAVVSEALIMTIDNTSINLQADPSVNNGQDKSKSSTLTVASNAVSGYTIYGALDNGDGSDKNRLKRSGGSGYIEAFDGVLTDNYFGYKAQNDSLNTADAQNGFAETATSIYTDAGVTAMGHNDVTNEKDHYINYDLNVDYLTPAGEYTGTITYTVAGSF